MKFKFLVLGIVSILLTIIGVKILTGYRTEAIILILIGSITLLFLLYDAEKINIDRANLIRMNNNLNTELIKTQKVLMKLKKW